MTRVINDDRVASLSLIDQRAVCGKDSGLRRRTIRQTRALEIPSRECITHQRDITITTAQAGRLARDQQRTLHHGIRLPCEVVGGVSTDTAAAESRRTFIYRAGVLVVHAGNRIDGPHRCRPRFPASSETSVAQALGDVLDRLRPDGVVTAAAAGADLLIVEIAINRRIPIHLLLPCNRSRFRAVSVADQGERWTSSFDRVVELATGDDSNSLVELGLEPDLDGLLAGNQALIDYASRLATMGLLAVAVRPAGGEHPASVTDDFVRRAELAGLEVIEVDPTSFAPGECNPVTPSTTGFGTERATGARSQRCLTDRRPRSSHSVADSRHRVRSRGASCTA